MVISILMGTLAAWGALCAVWAALGWLLPGSSRVTMILLCPETEPEPVIARCRWLLGLGLLRGRLIVAGDQVPCPTTDVRGELEICSLEELPARLELEREH